MAHRKVNSPKHLENGEIFFETPPQNRTKMPFFVFFYIPINNDMEDSEKIKFPFLCALKRTHRMPEVRCFFEISKIQNFIYSAR